MAHVKELVLEVLTNRTNFSRDHSSFKRRMSADISRKSHQESQAATELPLGLIFLLGSSGDAAFLQNLCGFVSSEYPSGFWELVEHCPQRL
jgi:hypothetical protein